MIQTIWANGYTPPNKRPHPIYGYDKRTRKDPKPRTTPKQDMAMKLFEGGEMCSHQIARLMGIENTAACHLLNKMETRGLLRSRRDWVEHNNAPVKIYRRVGND